MRYLILEADLFVPTANLCKHTIKAERNRASAFALPLHSPNLPSKSEGDGGAVGRFAFNREIRFLTKSRAVHA
jgi:hypothetical protein